MWLAHVGDSEWGIVRLGVMKILLYYWRAEFFIHASVSGFQVKLEDIDEAVYFFARSLPDGTNVQPLQRSLAALHRKKSH